MTDFARLTLDELDTQEAIPEIRTHSDAEMQRLTGVLLEHEVILPVVVNKQTGNVLKGRGVIAALKNAAMEAVVAQLVDLHPTAERIVRLCLHAQYGKNNNKAIAEELRFLNGEGVDLDFTGLPTPLIERLMNGDTKETKHREHTCPSCGNHFTE